MTFKTYERAHARIDKCAAALNSCNTRAQYSRTLRIVERVLGWDTRDSCQRAKFLFALLDNSRDGSCLFSSFFVREE
jgi:hypothetical protein